MRHTRIYSHFLTDIYLVCSSLTVNVVFIRRFFRQSENTSVSKNAFDESIITKRRPIKVPEILNMFEHVHQEKSNLSFKLNFWRTLKIEVSKNLIVKKSILRKKAYPEKQTNLD